MVEKYAKQSKDVSGQGVESAKQIRNSDSVRSMEYSLRVCISPFDAG